MPVFSLKMAQKLSYSDQIFFLKLSVFKNFLWFFSVFFLPFLTNFDFVSFFSLKMAENGPKIDLIKKNILLWRSQYCNNVMCAILKEFNEFWVWGLSSLKMAENGPKMTRS